MKPKTMAVAALVCGLSLGFFGQVFMQMFHTPPSSHQSIVDRMDIILPASSYELNVELVESKTIILGEGTQFAWFTYGETYVQTTWLWHRHGDTEFVMTIIGPGDDGVTYIVDVGKVGAYLFAIMLDGVAKFMTQPASSGANEGHYVFSVEIT